MQVEDTDEVADGRDEMSFSDFLDAEDVSDAPFEGLVDEEPAGDEAADADEAQDASGEADPAGEEDQEAGEQDDPSDDEGAPETKPAANSKLVLKLAKRDRELSELRKRVKELEAGGGQTAARLDRADRIGSLRSAVASELGLDPSDPKVTAELEEYKADLFLELIPADQRDADPSVKEFYERRKQELERRRKETELERRLEAIEQEKKKIAREQQAREIILGISQALEPKDFPFLAAADADAASTVYRVVCEDVAAGLKIRTHEDELKAWKNAATRLDAHHRAAAQRYSKVLGTSGDSSVGKEQSEPKKKAGQTITDKGASGAIRRKKAPEPQTRSPEDELESFLENEFGPRR